MSCGFYRLENNTIDEIRQYIGLVDKLYNKETLRVPMSVQAY